MLKATKNLAQEPEPVRLFVQDVIDFSSQYGKEGSNSYTVANIRAKPHYYPKYGDFLGNFYENLYNFTLNKNSSLPVRVLKFLINDYKVKPYYTGPRNKPGSGLVFDHLIYSIHMHHFHGTCFRTPN